MPTRSEVGDNVGRISHNLNWRAEADLLPAGAALAGKGCCSEQGAGAGPDMADMGARVLGRLVKADTDHGAV